MKLDLFTPEEKGHIKDLIAKGKPNLIASVVNIDDPRKEHQLVEYLDDILEPAVPFESKVRAKIERLESKGINPFETPEMADEWDKKLRAERQGWLENIKIEKEKKKKARKEKEEEGEKAENGVTVGDKKEEPKAEGPKTGETAPEEKKEEPKKDEKVDTNVTK